MSDSQWPQAWLFLGTGKTTTAMAAHLPGSKRALAENDGRLVEYCWKDSETGGNWAFQASRPGNLDRSDWNVEGDEAVVLSPGINPRREFFFNVRDSEVRELDLFCQLFKGQLVVITGTNAKSTITYQVGEVLKRKFSKEEVFVGGNLGVASFELFARPQQPKWAVLEVSSYQLERLSNARWSYGVLLNLSPDHLSRYDSLEQYYDQKREVLRRAFVPMASYEENQEFGVFREQESPEEITRRICGVIAEREGFLWTEQEFEDLPRLPHRLEVFFREDGGEIINDSKATNVSATLYALRETRRRHPSIHLIVGGLAKGESFTKLLEYLQREDTVWLVGEAAEKIREDLKGFPGRVRQFPSLQMALNEPSEEFCSSAILLSPACASFDEFKNFEERGQCFVRCMQNKFSCDRPS